MAENQGLLNDAPASRAPSANAWKLLYTASIPSSVSVHVCNPLAADAHFYIAVVPASVGYADGGVPPSYSLVSSGVNGKLIEADGGEYDSTVFNLGVGDVIVIRTDSAGVTFCNHGFTFS